MEDELEKHETSQSIWTTRCRCIQPGHDLLTTYCIRQTIDYI